MMKILRWCLCPTTGLVLSIVLLAAHPSFAQEDPLTLNDCLQQAFRQSNLLRIADLSVQIAFEKTGVVNAQKLPTLNVNGAYTRIGKVTKFNIPMGPSGKRQEFSFGTPNRINMDVRAQLPIFTWGRISSSIAIAELGQKMSTVQKQQQARNVTDQVLRAFYAILLNKKVIALDEHMIARADSHLVVAERRFNSGHVPKLELLRAQVQLKNAQGALLEARDNLVKSQIYLAKMLGTTHHHLDVAGEFSHEPITVTVEEVLSRAFQNRADLQTILLQQDINQQSLMLAKSADKLNLFVFSSYNIQNGFNPTEPNKLIDNWNVGAQVSIPLFDGFATRHRAQEAELELRSAHLREQELRQVIEMQIRQAVIALGQMDAKIMVQTENIQLAREALAIAERQYLSGLASSLDVIDAQQVLAQNELLQTQAIFNHTMTKIELCKAMDDYRWFEKSLAN